MVPSLLRVEVYVRGIPSGEAFKQFIELHQMCGDKVFIHPKEYSTQEEVREDLRAADVSLVPARYEPFGLTGLEAIASGTPVLISEGTGLADALKRFLDDRVQGLLVPVGTGPNSIDEAAQAFANRLRDLAAPNGVKKANAHAVECRDALKRALQLPGVIALGPNSVCALRRRFTSSEEKYLT